MSNKTVGENICFLRKEKKITQEELAKAVGISTQAVSKWECGGMPDSELLPIIADYLDVSIDRLFGRNINEYSDIKYELAKHIADIEQEERLNEVFEFCWILQKSMAGKIDIDSSVNDMINANPGGYQHSQMIFKHGLSLMSLSDKLPYFLLIPKPETGYESGFFDTHDYRNFFKLLSDQEVLDCLFLLYKRENKPFMPKLLENKLKISKEKSISILESLIPYKLIRTEEIEFDDLNQTVYNFNPNPAFILLLSITKEMIRKPNNYQFFLSSTNEPLF